MQTLSLWQIQLEQTDEKIAQLWTLLSADEQTRANRFYFPRHKRRFIVARGMLRKILSQHIHISAEKIQFEYLSHGKPQLAQQSSDNPLYFNLAHSHELALYAITNQPQIGIDIEFMRDEVATEEIVERYFSSKEMSEFLQIPIEKRQRAFFNGWTRKEAFIKAIGDGLSFPLKDFDVTLDNDTVQLLSVNGSSSEAKLWSLFSFQPAAGYVGAVAIKAKIVHWPQRNVEEIYLGQH